MAATHVKTVKSSSSSSVPVTTASTSFTAGNTLIAGIATSSGDAPNVTVSDITNSLSFTRIDYSQNIGAGHGMALFQLSNIPGGSVQIRATNLTAGDGGTLIVMEFSGLATSSVLDKEVSNNGGTTTSHATGTTAATTNANDLAIVAASKSGSTVVSQPSAWTNSYANINDFSGDSELDGTQFWYLTFGRKDLAATGTQQTTYTWTNSAYSNVLAALILAAGGGPTILLLNTIPSNLVRM